VKEQVTASAKKDKKAQMLTEKYNTAAGTATNIDEAAKKMSLTVSPAENVAFGNGYIAGLGNEPILVGTIFAMAGAKNFSPIPSKPVKGLNGVFIFTIEKITEPAETKDFSAQQKQINDQRKQRADYEVFNALKEKAEVEDNRGKFY
jgi:peptidyl-prolyl cis-trans isomerase D